MQLSILSLARLVIRDHSSLVLASSVQGMVACFTHEIAESTGILWGITPAVDRGLLSIVVEFDAQSVVNLFNSGTNVSSDIRLIIGDIRDYLRLDGLASISFVPRTGNVVAHNIAKFALLSSKDQFWMDFYPPCLESSDQANWVLCFSTALF
ncbi:hypothetical protein LWI28_007377 [Acer negundo]|uniref:RNase H type-1 domain-containing protein n=1 Tax=Acer negundo TaxID=4023 RepID=A0AAD5J9N6_ACENE|nr:hypothetical protein LWI28_007377 [Acer negundo]